MNKKEIGKIPLSNKHRSSFWRIFFPLILIFLICIFFAALLFNRTTGDPLVLNKWVNISLIIIAFLLFIPGILSLLIILFIIAVLGKIEPVLKMQLFKLQFLIENITRIFLTISRITLVPFTLLEILRKNKQKDERII